jgi:hypothetical protein
MSFLWKYIFMDVDWWRILCVNVSLWEDGAQFNAERSEELHGIKGLKRGKEKGEE